MGGGMSIEMWLAEDDQLAVGSELQSRVFDELSREPALETADLTVGVDARVVTLAGTVRSYPEKLVAERAARRVPGVRGVRNGVAVVLPTDARRTDRQIARAAAWALDSDVLVPRGRVTAASHDGWVELTGVVTHHAERQAAEEAVERLVGVNGVTNLVALEPPAVPPEDAAAQVEATLRAHAALHGDHVRVEAFGATIVLRGRVRSLAERDEAVQIAWGVPGVTAVQAELELGA
jgi:osmotically-inducible protein OsmY